MPGPDTLAEAPCVLVVGDRQVGKRALVAGLPGVRHGPDAAGPAALELDTKYYSATARVQIHGGGTPSPSAEQARDCEALILVFDATREATFQYAQRWAASESAEIRLCVANKADRLLNEGRIVRPSWLEAAQDWCTAEMLEYVEVASTSPEVDGTLVLNGEAQGVRRVTAALHAHMWPGLTMKGPSEAAAPSGETISRQRGSAAEPSGRSEPAQPAADAPEASGPGNGLAAVPQQAANGHAAEEPRTDEQLEAEMNGFENLMREVSSARGRLQGLPDAERRSAAEVITRRLMSQFGIADETDSDSDA